jgi:hypothetical protein
MTTFTTIPFSASTNFRGIKVTTTASPGDTVHAAQSGTTYSDFVTLTITNTDTVARPYRVQWGGTTSPDDSIVGVILPGSTKKICEKKAINNSLLVKVASVTMTWVDGASYTGAANVLTVHGQVQREAA